MENFYKTNVLRSCKFARALSLLFVVQSSVSYFYIVLTIVTMEAQSSSSGTKRKRNVLTLEKKLEIVNALKKGATASALSVQFDVPRTTINDIKKQSDDIVKFASQMESQDGRPRQRKVMKKATNVALDTALYLWFIQKRSEGIPLSGPIIAEKALFFNQKLNGDPAFKASSGWLEKFKNRHGIRQLNIEGEKLSAASMETVNAYKENFKKMIEQNGFTRDQVYNADETGLIYKALPTKTLAALSEKYAPGYKMQKQRVTAMVCANASGNNRIPLLLIGTAKKPRCFKNVNMKALPVHYYAQKNAWMTQSIFTDWFKNVFVPYVQRDLKSKNLPPKAILVLDNAPSHPEDDLKSDDGNITCCFLPANTTSLIQPMDQSVIVAMKRRYRKKFIQRLVAEDDTSLIDYWKAYNIKDVVVNVSDAWADVTTQTLQNAWNKLWPQTTDSNSDEIVAVTNGILAESNAAFSLECENDIVEWLNCDDSEVGYQLLTDEEILEIANEEENDTETDNDYDGGDTIDDATVEKTDLRKEAKEAVFHMEKFIDWHEKQEDSTQTDSMILRRLRNSAFTKSETTRKQSKVTEFFQKLNME